MTDLSFNYVRTFRQRYALTEEELARLIGLNSGTSISHIEQGDRPPTLQSALALQVVLAPAPSEMFPGLFMAIRKKVGKEAAVMLERIKGEVGTKAEVRREFLETVLTRASGDLL